MLSENFQVILICAALVILKLFVLVLIQRRHAAEQSIVTNSGRTLQRYSVDLQFDPYPRVTNIANTDACNAENLHECLIDDPRTLFNCKELLVKCHHFAADTAYINAANERIIIPKNRNINEGYALAITTLADGCNPYHGDLVLIANTNAESATPAPTTTTTTANAITTTTQQYMMVCLCKNPGYIGNDTLLGNCTTVYICDGAIDDLNKPLNEINCVCSEKQKSTRYSNGLPSCTTLTVLEANKLHENWSHLVPWSSNRLISSQTYNNDYSGNLNTTTLLDPCRNSLHDPTQEVINSQYNNVTNECNVVDYGYPLIMNMLKPPRPKMPIKAPEGAPKPPPPTERVTNVLSTGIYDHIRFTDNVGGVRRIYGIIVNGIKLAKNLSDIKVVLHPPNNISFGKNNALHLTVIPKEFISPKCLGSWPTYNCGFANYYEYDIMELPMPGFRSAPVMFALYSADWDKAEMLMRKTMHWENNGLTFDNEELMKPDQPSVYGIQYAQAKSDTESSGVVVFLNRDDYKIHQTNLL